jgi:very-short-patch-repair endonuclease
MSHEDNKSRLAHIYNDGLYRINGVYCPKCGLNWKPTERLGNDFLQSNYSLRDLCQSKAEIAFYNHEDSSMLPQVFFQHNNSGYFVDFANASTGIEIDGKQHNHHTSYDHKRDKFLRTQYGLYIRRYSFKCSNGQYYFYLK